MAIRAPWKGWVRTALPAVTSLILLNSFIVLMLALVNVAALELQYDDPPEYVQTSPVSIRASLLFFWCMIPLFLFLTSIAENWCLWTDRLGPLYVILASLSAIGLWALQVGLWDSCIGWVTASYCPYVYQNDGWGRYPDWAISSPQGAPYAVSTLFILYIIQLSLAAPVYHRQRRQSFRKSDIRHTLLQQLEEGDSQRPTPRISHPLENMIKSPTAPDEAEQHLIERSSDETARPSVSTSRRTTISNNWLTPLEPTASRPSLSSRRSTVSSLQDTPSEERRSFSHPPLTQWSSRTRSSSMSRYYTEYSPLEISESERTHATPGSRPSEDGTERRRSSSGLRESLGEGQRRISGLLGKRRSEGDGLGIGMG